MVNGMGCVAELAMLAFSFFGCVSLSEWGWEMM